MLYGTIHIHARTHTHTHNGIPSTAGEEAPQKKRETAGIAHYHAVWPPGNPKVSMIRVTQVTDHTYHQSSDRRQS